MFYQTRLNIDTLQLQFSSYYYHGLLFGILEKSNLESKKKRTRKRKLSKKKTIINCKNSYAYRERSYNVSSSRRNFLPSGFKQISKFGDL